MGDVLYFSNGRKIVGRRGAIRSIVDEMALYKVPKELQTAGGGSSFNYNSMFLFVGVSFTLKGQSFAEIVRILGLIKAYVEAGGKEMVLVHGFMPKHVVIEKGFSTEVVNALDEMFPLQIVCNRDGVPMREKMLELLIGLDGDVFVVGEVKDGVKVEVDLYLDNKIQVRHIPVDFEGEIATAKNYIVE